MPLHRKPSRSIGLARGWDDGEPGQIFVDARKAAGMKTGVGFYVSNLLKYWPAAASTRCLVSADTAPDLPWSIEGLKGGPFWHLRAARLARASRAMYFSPESLIVPILLGKKATVTVHDISPIRFPGLHTRRTVVVNRLLLKPALRRVRRIIVPTHTVRRDIEHYLPSVSHKLRVIYEGPKDISGADHQRCTNDSETNRYSPYVLYVGTIEPRKNVLRLVEAFLAAAPSTWSMVVAGKVGWLSSSEKMHFNTLCENPRVTYLGYVDDEALGGLYARAALFAYVSTVEGFGLPILEAMNRGIPVIHSDAEALCEIAGGAGLVVRLKQLDAELRRAIGQLTSDPAARRRLSELGKRRAELFTWRKAAQETFGVVSGLGGGGS